MSHKVGSVYVKSTREIIEDRSRERRQEVLFILGEIAGGAGFLVAVYYLVRICLSF